MIDVHIRSALGLSIHRIMQSCSGGIVLSLSPQSATPILASSCAHSSKCTVEPKLQAKTSAKTRITIYSSPPPYDKSGDCKFYRCIAANNGSGVKGGSSGPMMNIITINTAHKGASCFGVLFLDDASLKSVALHPSYII